MHHTMLVQPFDEPSTVKTGDKKEVDKNKKEQKSSQSSLALVMITLFKSVFATLLKSVIIAEVQTKIKIKVHKNTQLLTSSVPCRWSACAVHVYHQCFPAQWIGSSTSHQCFPA